jgi:hypothetical protein
MDESPSRHTFLSIYLHFYLSIYIFKLLVGPRVPSKSSMEFRKGSRISNWSPDSGSSTWCASSKKRGSSVVAHATRKLIHSATRH